MNPQQFLETINRFRVSRIILTAFELDLFTAIGSAGARADAIAGSIGADVHATDRLLAALCVLKLLKKKGDRYSLVPFAARHLVKGQPGYLAGLQHSSNLFNSWSHLTRVVRSGKPARFPASEGGPAGFIAAMHERAGVQAPRMVKLLDLSGVRRSIDIGCGSGAFSIALLQAQSDLKATLFDLPAVIPLTRTYMAAAGLEARCRFIKGSFSRDPFGSGYDLALLSAIIHMQSLAKNRRLFGKIYQALNPGGQIVIQDYIMADSRLAPEMGAFFAINMLVNTHDGDTFTAREVKAALQDAGFTSLRVIKTPFPAALVVGIKN
jgi:SAM-dependent methyltransferase